MSLKSVVLAESVLVGRERELEELQQFLGYAIAGKGGTVFVSGEAGSGKTRLTSEFLNLARKKGVTVLSGWCLSNAAVPYFPFVEAFDSYLSDNEESKSMGSQQLGLKTWLMGPNPAEGLANQGEMSPQAWKDQRFAAVTKELLFMSNNKPLVLFIDDLHWADSASLSLLHYIARAVGPEKILILATFRSEELSSYAEGFAHPLLDTLRLMGREDLFKEVKLLNLSKLDVGRIVENMLGGKVRGDLVEKLAEESRGNPLFVIESLRMLYENGSLVLENDQWRLAVDKLGIPTKVKDIILRRLSALKPNQRRILDVASVIGDKFDPQLIGAVLNQDSLEVLETLNTIALSSSLVCVEGDYYRFDHAKSREVLYEEILLPLKKGYHSRVAEKIESTNEKTGRLPVSDLASHYTQAGNKEKSVEYSLLTGKDALSRFSNAEAIKHFTYVLDATSESQKHTNEKLTALEGLGDALFASGVFQEAMKAFERLSDTAESGAIKLRAWRKAVLSSYWHGDAEHSLEIADKAEAYAQFDRLEYARVRLYSGFVAGRAGKAKEAIAYMEQSLRVFEESYSLPDVARALVEIGFIYPSEDRLEDALAAALRSVVFYKEFENFRDLEFAHSRLGSAFQYCGFFQESLDNYSEAIKIGSRVGDYNIMAFHFFMSGWVLESMGNHKAAIAKSLKGAECAEKTDAYYAQSLCYGALAREYAKIGEVENAEKYGNKLEKLFADVPALRRNNNAVMQAQMSKKALFSLKGQWKEANEIYEKRLALSGITPMIEVAGLRAGFAKLLAKQGRAEEAKIHLEEAKRIMENISGRFEHPNLQAYLMAPGEISVDEEMKARLDIVNIAKNPVTLLKIEDLAIPELKVSVSPSYINLEKGTLDMNRRKLNAFGVEPLKLKIQAVKAGTFNLKPNVVYSDDLGVTKTCSPKPIAIIVKQMVPQPGKESVPADATLTQGVSQIEKATIQTATELQQNFEFKSEAAQKAFNFLVNSFIEDCARQKLPRERSGWRTLMDIVKQGKVSKYSVYGSSGSRGHAISELERSGLVEARVFIGERGRGGKILKVRVAYEKEIVRCQIDQRDKIGKNF